MYEHIEAQAGEDSVLELGIVVHDNRHDAHVREEASKTGSWWLNVKVGHGQCPALQLVGGDGGAPALGQNAGDGEQPFWGHWGAGAGQQVQGNQRQVCGEVTRFSLNDTNIILGIHFRKWVKFTCPNQNLRGHSTASSLTPFSFTVAWFERWRL